MQINYENIVYALIVLIIIASIYWWFEIVSSTPNPSGSIYESVHKRKKICPANPFEPGQGFYLFPGLGVLNTSTTLRDPEGALLPKELAKNCRLFGKDCIGFDSDGNLVLSRDKETLRFRKFEDNKKYGYYRHMPGDQGYESFKKQCTEEFGGEVKGRACVMTDAQTDALVRKLNNVKNKKK